MAAPKNNWLLLAIIFLGFCLRAFNLGSIPGQTFDEVFYPVFALNYILGQTFFSVHPPVGTYLISLSIYIYHLLPWTEPVLSSGVNISDLNPVSYRWLNVIAGTTLIYVAYKLCIELFDKKHIAIDNLKYFNLFFRDLLIYKKTNNPKNLNFINSIIKFVNIWVIIRF